MPFWSHNDYPCCFHISKKGGDDVRGILIARWKQLLRNPWTFLCFTGLSIGFALILGLTGAGNTIRVPIAIVDEEVHEAPIISQLKQETTLQFYEMKEQDLLQFIEDGKAEVGVLLSKDSYKLVVGVESTTVTIAENIVRQTYVNYFQQQSIIDRAHMSAEEEKSLLQELEENLNEPIFTIQASNFRTDEAVIYNPTYQFLFGFSLFFVIYTIGHSTTAMLTEKKQGIWDRIILSPVSKWKMYVGNLIYSFFEGYLQVVIIFSFFFVVFDIDYNGMLWKALLLLIPYVFAMVALTILLISVIKNIQQFNVLITIVAVSMAMIGGAYWPIEIVESKILLTLAKFNPVAYAMEALKGVVNYGYSWDQLYYPISILLLMGVVMISIGIHLMERRHI
nr:ABC transporter permease [Roseburia sp. 1XD42-34]